MVLHFKSKASYRKWNAFRAIHGIKTKHKQKVFVAGKEIKVRHM